MTLTLVALAWFALPAMLFAAPTPEEETEALSRILKPISDVEWKTIAGSRQTEKYEIIKGDTLYDISIRLFSDGKYWPKIWALNNGNITNPHLIQPGNFVVFLPGSGSALPSVSLGDNPETQRDVEPAVLPEKPKGRSMEWQKLPRQGWETVQIVLPPETDIHGFDQRNKVLFHDATGIDLMALATSETLPTLGEITGSRTEANYLSLADTVFIKGEDELQVGETYSVTQDPLSLSSWKSDRSGYAYYNMGRIKIIGVRDGVFIGTITEAKMPLFREAVLIKNIPEQKIPRPVPGPSPLEGVIMFDIHHTGTMAAQHHTVFIDRGSSDEVTPGMIFRAYVHEDPNTWEEITSNDFVIHADFIVVNVSEQFSTALSISSYDAFPEHKEVVLLTDVSEYLSGKGKIGSGGELDELDDLDSSGSLGDKEARELKQLENWEGNKEGYVREKEPEELEEDIESDDKEIEEDSSDLDLEEEDSSLDEGIDEEAAEEDEDLNEEEQVLPAEEVTEEDSAVETPEETETETETEEDPPVEEEEGEEEVEE